MASIFRHQDRWRASVFKHGQRQSKVFDTKREAVDWALKREQELDGLKDSAGKTLRTAVEHYRKNVTPTKDSIRWENNALDRLLTQLDGSLKLAKIDSAVISAWRDRRLRGDEKTGAKPVSGSTVVRETNLLRNIFTKARDEWKWIAHDPFKGVEMPDENPPRETVWRWHQIKRVLRANRDGLTGETIRAFHIALHTGMRLKEVLGHSFDPNRNVATLGKTKGTRAGTQVRIPVTRRAARAMKKLSKEPFTVDPNMASTLFSKLCSQLLIEGLTFHDSRATALTLLSRRMDVMTLARISRHKDLKILLNTYYRETPDQIAARL